MRKGRWDQQKLNEFDKFADDWIHQQGVSPAVVAEMILEVSRDVQEGKGTNGNYHDNQCYLHGILSEAFIPAEKQMPLEFIEDVNVLVNAN